MSRLEIISKFFLALASTVVLMISGTVIPPAGVILIPFVPQPVLSFGIRYGAGWGAGVLGAAFLLLFLFAGAELAFIYLIFALMASLLFGLLGRLRVIEWLVLSVASVVFAALVGFLFCLYGSWSVMLQDLRSSLTEHMAAAVRVQEKMGFAQDTTEVLKERLPAIAETMLQVLPGLVFVSLSLIVLLNILFLCRRFPDRREEWLTVDNLREWNAPEPLVWGLIICGFSLFISGPEFLHTLAVNLLLVIAACYFFQGLAIVAYFFHKSRVPYFLRMVTYALIIFQQIFTLLVVGLGLFDLWGDFRRLKKKDLNPSQVS
ncbi:MAG: DUF2232 domain-containing protein [Candidatus Binatia bacterium]